MTGMMAKAWLEAMKAEGHDVEQSEHEALNEAIIALNKRVAVKAVKNSKGELFCSICNTKMGRNNQNELAKYCLHCGQRLVPDFVGRNSNGDLVKKDETEEQK